jgi:thioredoxin 1
LQVKLVEDSQAFYSEVECAEQKVLVKFEAEWCMPCKAMASVVEEVARVLPDVKVVAVDVDGDGMDPILKKYSIRSVPTFIHVSRGSFVNQTTGLVTKDELFSLFDEDV